MNKQLTNGESLKILAEMRSDMEILAEGLLSGSIPPAYTVLLMNHIDQARTMLGCVEDDIGRVSAAYYDEDAMKIEFNGSRQRHYEDRTFRSFGIKKLSRIWKFAFGQGEGSA
jgi:hypothetical protein